MLTRDASAVQYATYMDKVTEVQDMLPLVA